MKRLKPYFSRFCLFCQVIDVQADLVQVGGGFGDGGNRHDGNTESMRS